MVYELKKYQANLVSEYRSICNVWPYYVFIIIQVRGGEECNVLFITLSLDPPPKKKKLREKERGEQKREQSNKNKAKSKIDNGVHNSL